MRNRHRCLWSLTWVLALLLVAACGGLIDHLVAEVDGYAEQIISGEITVPATTE